MADTRTVLKNKRGGYYEQGRGYSKAKWASFLDLYLTEVKSAGKYPIWRLMEMAQIGRKTARKAITYYAVGKIVPSTKCTAKGIGVLKGMSMEHHAFIQAAEGIEGRRRHGCEG